MKLEHKELPPFVPLLPKILKVAFHSGTRFLESKGLSLIDIDSNPIAKDTFVRGCHQGYDRAQRRIGDLVIDLARRIRFKNQQLKQLRQKRSDLAREVHVQIRVLQDRQLILRRILDTILFTIVGPNEWVLRRLGEETIKKTDPKVLRRMLEIAFSRNRESPYRFSLIADLTTIVHLGDLIEVEWSEKTGKQWHLIEVKEGEVNWKISEIVTDRQAWTPIQKAEKILNTLGSHALKQAERMAKQQIRLAELGKILETDKGVDFKTKQEIVLSPDVIKVEDYSEEISKVVEGATDLGVAGETIDGCLHLLAVRADFMPDEFSVAHGIFHLANPEEPCRFLEKDQFYKEVKAVTSMKAPVVDLVDLTMKSQCGYPIFLCSGIPENRILDLIAGQVRIFAQFDLEAFMRIAARYGLPMSPVVGREAQRLEKISKEIPGCPGAWGIRVENESGHPQTLLVGFFSRPFYYFTRPSELLRLAQSFPEEDSTLASGNSPEPTERTQQE